MTRLSNMIKLAAIAPLLAASLASGVAAGGSYDGHGHGHGHHHRHDGHNGHDHYSGGQTKHVAWHKWSRSGYGSAFGSVGYYRTCGHWSYGGKYCLKWY